MPEAEEYSERPKPAQAADADERLAAQIREHREAAGMSQDGLAKSMSAGGVTWYPQTVHRVETGARKVSVGEAKVLAEIFHTTVDRLTWPGKEASAAGLMEMATGRAVSAWEQIAAWTASLLWNQRHLGTTVAEVEAAGLESPKMREIAEEARKVLEMTPEAAVEQGHRDHARMQAEGDDQYEDEDGPAAERPGEP